MRVACFVNPLVQASGPGFNYGGVEALAKLVQPLRREARCECMLITGGWFKEWARRNGKAHLLTGLRTIWLDELLLYRRIRELGELPTALDQTVHQAVFLDEFRRYQSSSQFLVPRVDGVWSVSSSVGYQALLFNRLLGSPPSTELSNVSDATTLADFFGRLRQHKSANADTFLAWLLERYLVPATLLTDGRWFHDYLQRRLDAARSATSPIDGFVPTADADRLMDAWIAKASGPLTIKPLQWHDDPSIAEVLADLRAVRRERDALLKSTSWRITAPLRFVKQAAVRRMRLAASFPRGVRAKQPTSAAC
jgi:hypothetical protein